MSVSKKIVLLGHFGVGKTSVMRKYVTDEFKSDYKVTIGVHILKKELKDLSLILWDIEGTKDIKLINKSYLLGAHSFIITYDITRPSTFQNLETQIAELKINFPNTLIKVIGNKIDLIEKTAIHQDRDKKIVSITDFLTSAKTGENIETLFNSIASELLSK